MIAAGIPRDSSRGPGCPNRAPESLLVWLEPLARVAPAGRDDRGGREQAGLDRRPDALSALRIRQAGGVTDQHHAVDHVRRGGCATR